MSGSASMRFRSSRAALRTAGSLVPVATLGARSPIVARFEGCDQHFEFWVLGIVEQELRALSTVRIERSSALQRCAVERGLSLLRFIH